MRQAVVASYLLADVIYSGHAVVGEGREQAAQRQRRACVVRVDDDARRLGRSRARRSLEIGEAEADQLDDRNEFGRWPFRPN